MLQSLIQAKMMVSPQIDSIYVYLVIGTMRVRVLYNPFCPSPSTDNVFLPRYPVLSAQAMEGLACARRRTSAHCVERSRQAGKEGDWRAGGCRSRAEVTGGQQVIGHHSCGKKFALQRLNVILL